MRILAISKSTSKATQEALTRGMNDEVAKGKQFFEQEFIIEGYMDSTYTDAYMILESPSVEEAHATLASYPNTQAGLNTWNLFPLIGLPAISQSLQERHLPLPTWWPQQA